MKVEVFNPTDELRGYVHRIIFIKNDTMIDIVSQMIPRGLPGFIFTFPDQPLILNYSGSSSRHYKPSSLYFNGIVTESVKTLFPSGCCFFVALIQPHCTGLFHREDAVNFIDHLYDLTACGQLIVIQ